MDTQKIKKPLNTFVKIATKVVSVDKIILYGSFARGDASTWSDIDVVVIGSTDIDTLYSIADSIDSQFSFDIRSYKRDQFDTISPLSIYSEIKREGITIYSKE
ncbi:MAG: nucleotidyltransferase domain-containing protein [Candidatus Roizmanbacteria bacterium]|nr:nucleotidyltransferase domain-containing protein [Candidatus Roizmanbacteria bacterium]